jgi:hypothetical protein
MKNQVIQSIIADVFPAGYLRRRRDRVKTGHFQFLHKAELPVSWSCRLSVPGGRDVLVLNLSAFGPYAVTSSRQSQQLRMMTASDPATWATMKPATPAGAIPAKVSDSERAMVTAGLAKEVEAVNQ